MSMRSLSLNTKLVAGCMVMLGFSLTLSISLILIYGSHYLRTERDILLLTQLKRVIEAGVSLAQERAQSSFIVSMRTDPSAEDRDQLARRRAKSDATIASVLQAFPPDLPSGENEDLLKAIQKMRSYLTVGRGNFDRLLAEPRSKRAVGAILQAIRDMFNVSDQFSPITSLTIGKIAAEDHALVGPAVLAQMVGELRDYAGRYGAVTIPYLASSLSLPDDAAADLAMLRGRILELWQSIGRLDSVYAGDDVLQQLRQGVTSRYFSTGLPKVDRIIALGRTTGDYQAPNPSMLDGYGRSLGAIDDLGAGVLDTAYARLASERASALIWLAVISIGSALIVAATLTLIILARQYVLRPLMLASNHIVALSHREPLGELVSPTHSHEMLQLFDALEGLRIILDQREQHTERLKILSETDGLTGLINRRLFDRIGQGDAEFDSLAKDASIIMMDLDRFKSINDTYGHTVGDHVLRHSAAIVQRVCRKTDIAARYGGEEIAIVILEKDSWVAMHVAERIRSELESEPVILADGTKINVTASFGVAHGRRGGKQWQNLVKQADAALYDAKETGRNRVCRAAGTNHPPARNVA